MKVLLWQTTQNFCLPLSISIPRIKPVNIIIITSTYSCTFGQWLKRRLKELIYFLNSSNLFFISSNWSPSIFACASSSETSCSFGIAGMPSGVTGAPAGACCSHDVNCGICPVWARYCAAGGNPIGLLPIQPGEYPNRIQPGNPV